MTNDKKKSAGRKAPESSYLEHPITIDADVVRGEPIKSIEVDCKIEHP